MALTFFHRLLIKQTVYFKGFNNVSVTINKYDKGHVKTKVIKEITG